jgi:micrococcal nuclease
MARYPLIVLLLLAPVLVLAERFQARVVGVSDGDTVTVVREVGGRTEQVRIRLHGVDAPESGQPFGQVAKKFASDAVFGKTVLVDVRDRDNYGRSVAVIFYENPDTTSDKLSLNLNHELVRSGLAWWYRQYARDDRDLRDLEAAARRARKGLWAEPNPVAPWEWRRQNRARH